MQSKGISPDQLGQFMFKPFNRETKVSMKAIKDLLEENDIVDKMSLLIARYLIEPRESEMVDFAEDESATQA